MFYLIDKMSGKKFVVDVPSILNQIRSGVELPYGEIVGNLDVPIIDSVSSKLTINFPTYTLEMLMAKFYNAYKSNVVAKRRLLVLNREYIIAILFLLFEGYLPYEDLEKFLDKPISDLRRDIIILLENTEPIDKDTNDFFKTFKNKSNKLVGRLMSNAVIGNGFIDTSNIIRQYPYLINTKEHNHYRWLDASTDGKIRGAFKRETSTEVNKILAAAYEELDFIYEYLRYGIIRYEFIPYSTGGGYASGGGGVYNYENHLYPHLYSNTPTTYTGSYNGGSPTTTGGYYSPVYGHALTLGENGLTEEDKYELNQMEDPQPSRKELGITSINMYRDIERTKKLKQSFVVSTNLYGVYTNWFDNCYVPTRITNFEYNDVMSEHTVLGNKKHSIIENIPYLLSINMTGTEFMGIGERDDIGFVRSGKGAIKTSFYVQLYSYFRQMALKNTDIVLGLDLHDLIDWKVADNQFDVSAFNLVGMTSEQMELLSPKFNLYATSLIANHKLIKFKGEDPTGDCYIGVDKNGTLIAAVQPLAHFTYLDSIRFNHVTSGIENVKKALMSLFTQRDTPNYRPVADAVLHNRFMPANTDGTFRRWNEEVHALGNLLKLGLIMHEDNGKIESIDLRAIFQGDEYQTILNEMDVYLDEFDSIDDLVAAAITSKTFSTTMLDTIKIIFNNYLSEEYDDTRTLNYYVTKMILCDLYLSYFDWVFDADNTDRFSYDIDPAFGILIKIVNMVASLIIEIPNTYNDIVIGVDAPFFKVTDSSTTAVRELFRSYRNVLNEENIKYVVTYKEEGDDDGDI